MFRASSLAGLSPLNRWSRVWVPYGCARGMKMEFGGMMSRSRLSQQIPRRKQTSRPTATAVRPLANPHLALLG